jgi:hypothetical protein
MKDLFYTIGQCTYYIENNEFHLLDEKELSELRREVLEFLESENFS